MNAVEHRSISRLPLEIFENLQKHAVDTPFSAEDLRREIAAKLKATTTKTFKQESFHLSINNLQQKHTGNKIIVTVGDLLRLCPSALLCALDPLLSYTECDEMLRRICLATAPKSTTAHALLQRNQHSTFPQNFLSTGLSSLDRHLMGGFRIGSITEVVGCAGTGKTQLALQTALLTNASTMFVDTESKLSLQRLHDMSDSPQILRNITIYSPSNLEELLKVLSQLEDEIVSHVACDTPVRLLVIDSMASPARRHEFTSAAVQTATILQMAQSVKRLADQYQLVALVVNQVSSSDSSSTKAALGLAWHHCITTRLQLEMTTEISGEIVARHATVVKSNIVGISQRLEFMITKQGLVDAHCLYASEI